MRSDTITLVLAIVILLIAAWKVCEWGAEYVPKWADRIMDWSNRSPDEPAMVDVPTALGAAPTKLLPNPPSWQPPAQPTNLEAGVARGSETRMVCSIDDRSFGLLDDGQLFAVTDREGVAIAYLMGSVIEYVDHGWQVKF